MTKFILLSILSGSLGAFLHLNNVTYYPPVFWMIGFIGGAIAAAYLYESMVRKELEDDND